VLQPDLPVLDETVLAELLASTGDDPAFVRELLETYLAETPEQLLAIRTAVDAGNASELVRPAHTLKSSSATLGAMRLSALARDLEMAARTDSLPPDIEQMVEGADRVWRSTAEALEVWFSGEDA